jgi:molecular chaperone GrpE
MNDDPNELNNTEAAGQDDVPSSRPGPEQGCDCVQIDEVSQLEARCQEYLEGWKRAVADYANLKRESERREADLTKYAVGELVRKLLPVVDSWDKAEAHRPAPREDGGFDATAVTQWMDGLTHVRNQLHAALEKAGVTVIAETGVPFDPNMHEALMTEKAEGVASGTVTKILDPGVRLHDRVLKAAKVTVAE